MFQSLTGRLKTAVLTVQALYREQFQSLTGRLKTAQRDELLYVHDGFQSLTGRLKTKQVGDANNPFAYVSIPHR